MYLKVQHKKIVVRKFQHYKRSISNHTEPNTVIIEKDLIEALGRKLGVQQLEDWYSFDTKTIEQNGGKKLLTQNGGSISRLLQNVYPNHKWYPWKFAHVTRGFWNVIENQKEFM